MKKLFKRSLSIIIDNSWILFVMFTPIILVGFYIWIIWKWLRTPKEKIPV